MAVILFYFRIPVVFSFLVIRSDARLSRRTKGRHSPKSGIAKVFTLPAIPRLQQTLRRAGWSVKEGSCSLTLPVTLVVSEVINSFCQCTGLRSLNGLVYCRSGVLGLNR
jgi:hypothetical protein